MTSLFELLAGGLPSEAEYRADNPLFNAARGMASIQVQPRTSAEAWWMPATQGLLSGFLQGAGKAQARQAQYSDIKALPGIQQLLAPSPDFIGPPDPMHAYTSETAPEGWTPKIGKADMIMAALSAQTQQEEAIRKAEHAAKFEEMLANKYGAMLTPEGGITAIPQLRQIQAENAGAEAGAKKAAELNAEGGMTGFNSKMEEETDKLRKEFSGLPEVKKFSIIENAGKVLNQALADPNAVSDQELVRMGIQIIEPGLSVREGEQAAIAGSQSIPDAWKGEINKALRGGSALSNDVREGLRRLAERHYQGAKAQYDTALTFYQSEAKKKNLDPERISYLGEAAPSLITKNIGGRTYYKVNGGWQAK